MNNEKYLSRRLHAVLGDDVDFYSDTAMRKIIYIALMLNFVCHSTHAAYSLKSDFAAPFIDRPTRSDDIESAKIKWKELKKECGGLSRELAIVF